MAVNIKIHNKFSSDNSDRSLLAVQHSSLDARVIGYGGDEEFTLSSSDDFITIYFYEGGDIYSNPFNYILGYDKAADGIEYVTPILPPCATHVDITDPPERTFKEFRITKFVPPIWRVKVAYTNGFEHEGPGILSNGNVTVGDDDQ